MRESLEMNCLVRADEAEHCKHQNWNDVGEEATCGTGRTAHAQPKHSPDILRGRNFGMALPGQSRGSRRRTVTGMISEENWYQAQLEQSWHTPGTLSGRYSEIVHLAKFEETEEDTAAIECTVDVTNARNFSKWSKSSTLEARRRNEQMLNSDKMAFSKCPGEMSNAVGQLAASSWSCTSMCFFSGPSVNLKVSW